MSSMELRCSDLDIAVNGRVLVSNLKLQFPIGSITCVLGRNGTGKSLTLHTLAGLRSFDKGTLQLGTESLSTLSRRRVAQQLAFVAQDIEEPFPVTVLECAVSGRHPHIDFWQWESTEDYALARHCLSEVDLGEFAERSVQTLSGGERRRLAIAVALTQAPDIFILDEPINHLDPQHQLQVLKLLRHKANEGRTVIMTLHDPNLALQFGDLALLLFGDGRWNHGDMNILNDASISELYRTPMRTVQAGDRTLVINA
jgi:iron complex transport system ATP-binding protein